MTIKLPKDVEISGAEFNLYQPSDSCDSEGCGQNLKIKLDDAGGGHFVVISTERWAMDVDEIETFSDLLKSLVTQVRDTIKK